MCLESVVNIYSIYIYFCPRTLSALPHDCLPTLEPVTRSWISARFMSPGHETPRARWGVLLGWRAAVRALLATYAPSPCASKVHQKPGTFPLRRLGRPRTARVRGVASLGRSGPEVVLKIIFGSAGPESSQSAPSGRMGSFGTVPQQAVESWRFPDRNVFRGWYRSKIRAGNVFLISFGSG